MKKPQINERSLMFYAHLHKCCPQVMCWGTRWYVLSILIHQIDLYSKIQRWFYCVHFWTLMPFIDHNIMKHDIMIIFMPLLLATVVNAWPQVAALWCIFVMPHLSQEFVSLIINWFYINGSRDLEFPCCSSKPILRVILQKVKVKCNIKVIFGMDVVPCLLSHWSQRLI